MNILIAGLINIETTLKVRNFPINYYPIDYPFFGINSSIAGVGYNVSKALHTLGSKLCFVSYIGNDMGSEYILHQLQKDGIAVENILQILKETPQSVVLYNETGRRQIYCDLKDIQVQTINCNIIQKNIIDADIVVACNINFNRPLLFEAKRYGKIIATYVHVLSDINDEYNRDFLMNSDILFLSNEGIPCSTEEFIYLLKEKYEMKIIVVGEGENGATLYTREKNIIQHFNAVKPEKVINSVGAGDALFSSFIYFYGKGLSAEESLKRAQLFTSIKIGYNGAAIGFVSEDEIERKINNIF
ncbi:MAG: carbohydrate kinase family protein [Fusobacteria bacterium]|nr:carbohydrate kinase family protein [Fusobacteriota bacterium]